MGGEGRVVMVRTVLERERERERERVSLLDVDNLRPN